jgi:hypothetical protein
VKVLAIAVVMRRKESIYRREYLRLLAEMWHLHLEVLFHLVWLLSH